MNAEEKVISMEEYRKPQEQGQAPTLDSLNAKTSHDISRVSLVLALVAVLLSGVLFFKANQSISGLSQDVAGLGTKIGTMDGRMAELENMPAKTKKMVLNTMIMEMAQKASYLSSQVDDQEQAAKLMQAMELLQQARP